MNATAHFYDMDTTVYLQTSNAKGGSTFTMFDSVGDMLNYAEGKGIEIVNQITHHDC